MDTLQLRKSIRNWLIFFIVALIISGITASPIESELAWVNSWWPEKKSGFYQWINRCYMAIHDINQRYPFLAYGYDWLSFAHVVIGIAFVGPLRNPVRNIWVIEFSIIACFLVIPLAIVAGQIRGIPFYWRLIDCSFGFIGLIPLLIVHRKIKKLELYTATRAMANSQVLTQKN